MLEAIVVAFGVVFVAELGDKSQLMAFTFGTRFPARWVFVGLLVAFGVINVLSVGVGTAIGELVSARTATLLAGIVFLGAAIFVWFDHDDDENGTLDTGSPKEAAISTGSPKEAAISTGSPKEAAIGTGSPKEAAIGTGAARGGLSVVVTVASSVGLAELGDKTMFVTAGLAANGANAAMGALATWIGATLGETAAASIGLVAGRSIGSRLSPATLRLVSTVMFIGFGLVMVISALLPE